MEIWLFYGGIALIYVVFALSLNLLLGFAGQVSVAHAAFGAIGGYTVGYLTLNKDWNFLPALAIGIAIAFVVGTIVALPAMRLSVEYLILLTLAISSVIIGAFTTFPELGGTYGLINLPTAELFGWTLAHPRDWVLPLLAVAAFTYWFTDRLGESPYGRVLRGIREDGQAVQSLGKNVFRFKLSVFAITSALAALAGGLFSAFEHLATPSLFGFAISLTIFAMVILGGMGNLTGSVVGAVVLASLDPILTRVIGLSADKAFFVQFIAYGLLLVVMMRLRPEGVLPEGFSLLRWVRRERQPLAGRVEMVRAEGWVPEVSAEVAQLARAEHEFLDQTATITAGASVTGNGDAERARAGLWAAAPVVLEVSALSKRFGGIVAADDLTFTLRQGAIAALVGPNGAGKTTVFNLLTGFIPPDRGSVRLRGVELVGAPPDEVARMGMVRSFQDVRLFQRLSCVTNVAMAVPGQPGERVPSLLGRPGAVRRFEAEAVEKARGWLTFVGMQKFAEIPTGALSYGQTKLVSLARVLATEAEVILLDEPASGIDDVWVNTMLGLIESLRERGRTICIVEHNLHVVGRLADHTYFMELGRITAEGTIGELTGSERLAEAYFGTV
jgi:branched-chain amino acid transport system ATP-binding protein/branched-chain amino acid transport system permease protein